MRFPSLHKLHAQKYKTSLSHRFMQCSGKPGRWVIFHIPFCAVSARGATAEPPGRAASTTYFNSRPCERGDPDAALSAARFFRFQFTPLREGRPPSTMFSSFWRIFQFTPLREGRPAPRSDSRNAAGFQFTPLREGRQLRRRQTVRERKFQFTPLREGRLLFTNSTPFLFSFQFTPLREGRPTNGIKCKCMQTLISIHAPARGATLQPPWHRSEPGYFNSRPCERGDPQSRAAAGRPGPISIHAPARGATSITYPPPVKRLNFNSRPCERGDPEDMQHVIDNYFDFNSRPCERGDSRHVERQLRATISIHAPARGATRRLRRLGPDVYFNSRPCERGDSSGRK